MTGAAKSEQSPSERVAVDVTNVGFRYPGAREDSLTEIDFRIEVGQRVGLLGPNGAGKSTLMRLLCGYLACDAKDANTKIRIAGIDVAADPLGARRNIGYLPEQVPIYPEMRVREQLMFRATLKHIPIRRRRAEISRVCEQVGLKDMLETTIGRLSRGYRQRVGIADALLGRPAVVILDEPTIGLDPNQILEIRDLLMGLSKSQTLIFSSHILQDVEALCDRILIMSRGRLVADESVAENGPASLIVEWLGEVKGAALAVLERVFAGHGRTLGDEDAPDILQGRTGVVLSEPSVGMAESIGRESLAEGLVITRLESGRARLEERFAQVTGFRGGWHQ